MRLSLAQYRGRVVLANSPALHPVTEDAGITQRRPGISCTAPSLARSTVKARGSGPAVLHENPGECVVRHRIITLLAAIVALVSVAGVGAQSGRQIDRRPFPGTVYTASNSPAGNAILLFDRLADGRLVPAGTVATGGIGTGTGLGTQGGLMLTRDERWLLAVNAGSNSLSVFEVRKRGLRLADVVPTGGSRPISVTEHRGVVYVVHATSDDIAGFTLGRNGHLQPLVGSVQGLSGAGVGPAQIAFTPDGGFLLVTEKNTNRIVTFDIDRRGLPTDRRVQDASGVTPFGFAFGKRNQVFVTEAFGGAPGASATSSYDLGRDGLLTPISTSVPTGQKPNYYLTILVREWAEVQTENAGRRPRSLYSGS